MSRKPKTNGRTAQAGEAIKITATVTDSRGRVLAEDKGDGDGLQEVGDNLKESLAELGFSPAPRVLFDEHGSDFIVPVAKDGKIAYGRKSLSMLKYPFSDKERAELAREAGQLEMEARSKKASLDAVKKQMQGDIDTTLQQVSNILTKCRDGYEYRETNVGVIFHHPKKGQKIIVRLDTEEVVEVRSMEGHEFQATLFNEEEEAGDASPA